MKTKNIIIAVALIAGVFSVLASSTKSESRPANAQREPEQILSIKELHVFDNLQRRELSSPNG